MQVYFDSVVGINQVIEQLPGFFDAFPSDDFYANQTALIVGNSQAENRPYFKRLREQLSLRVDRYSAILSDVEIDRVISNLCFDRAPLLEKVNVFMFYQDWFRGKSLIAAADSISISCNAFFNKDLAGKRHKTVYGHFALDLLAQMYRDFKLSPTPMYAGFDSFVRMSAGVPRNLLVILRNIYKWSSFNGEVPFRGAAIPISTQCEAIKQSAGFFFEEDARPGADVPDTQLAVERLAEFLREVRFSSKPVEVSPLAFSVDHATLSEQSKITLKLAENWSYIFKIPRGRPNANSQHLDEKFQLNPMLASKWDLPISVRGDVRISASLADAIFGRASNEVFKLELQNSTASLKAPSFGKGKSAMDSNSQPTLVLDFGPSDEI
jgi:hypothetical protein